MTDDVTIGELDRRMEAMTAAVEAIPDLVERVVDRALASFSREQTALAEQRATATLAEAGALVEASRRQLAAERETDMERVQKLEVNMAAVRAQLAVVAAIVALVVPVALSYLASLL